MLSEEELRHFGDQIAAELENVEAALADAAEGEATIELDQSRVGRLSRMDAMQQQAMASDVHKRLLRRKLRLQAAAERVRTGQFGVCCDCAGAIVVERLRVDVGAPFCAYCQEELDERREKA